ncbi:MAG: hypothetical protein V7707_08670 [Motiliproteus sp.]
MSWIAEHWYQLFGLIFTVAGVHWCYSRTVGIGIKGRPTAFYIKGKPAVAIGLFVICFGVWTMLSNGELFKIDKCLDSGGSFNHSSHICDYE